MGELKNPSPRNNAEISAPRLKGISVTLFSAATGNGKFQDGTTSEVSPATRTDKTKTEAKPNKQQQTVVH